MTRSWVFSSIRAEPHVVALPALSNLQPHNDWAWAPHWPLSRDASQKPEPTGRPLGLPSPLTATSNSPLPVVPFWQVKLPEVVLKRILSLPSHVRVVELTWPFPSTSSCSIHDWESGGVVIFRCSVPIAVVFVVPAGGGVPAFFCTSEGFTLIPADLLGSCATATARPTTSSIATIAHLVITFFIFSSPAF